MFRAARPGDAAYASRSHLREMTCDPHYRRVLIRTTAQRGRPGDDQSPSPRPARDRLCRRRRSLEAVPGMAELSKIDASRSWRLDVTDTESVTETRGADGGRIDISSIPAETRSPRTHHRARQSQYRTRRDGHPLFRDAAGWPRRSDRRCGSPGADGTNSATPSSTCCRPRADELARPMARTRPRRRLPLRIAMHAGPSFGRAASECSTRFFGPLETEWFQTVPPPKLAPRPGWPRPSSPHEGRQRGYFRGRHRLGFRERLKANPKALERELGSQ